MSYKQTGFFSCMFNISASTLNTLLPKIPDNPEFLKDTVF